MAASGRQTYAEYLTKVKIQARFNRGRKPRKKCRYSVLFWYVFSRILTEYRDIQSISLYSSDISFCIYLITIIKVLFLGDRLDSRFISHLFSKILNLKRFGNMRGNSLTMFFQGRYLLLLKCCKGRSTRQNLITKMKVVLF